MVIQLGVSSVGPLLAASQGLHALCWGHLCGSSLFPKAVASRAPSSLCVQRTAAEARQVANRRNTPPCRLLLTCLSRPGLTDCLPPNCCLPSAAPFFPPCTPLSGDEDSLASTVKCWALPPTLEVGRSAQIPMGWPACPGHGPSCAFPALSRVPLKPQIFLLVAAVRLLRRPLPAPLLLPLRRFCRAWSACLGSGSGCPW